MISFLRWVGVFVVTFVVGPMLTTFWRVLLSGGYYQPSNLLGSVIGLAPTFLANFIPPIVVALAIAWLAPKAKRIASAFAAFWQVSALLYMTLEDHSPEAFAITAWAGMFSGLAVAVFGAWRFVRRPTRKDVTA